MSQPQPPPTEGQSPQPPPVVQTPAAPLGYPMPYPYPGYPPPYPGYPYPTLAPPKEYPVPPARNTPLIWLVSLVVLTVVAVALALGGALATTGAPAPFATTAYHSSLASDDGMWDLQSSANGSQCTYANGGLDAVAANGDGIAPVCHLKGQSPTDFQLSVVVLPQAPLTYQLEPAIFIHSTLEFLFNPSAGAFAVYVGDSTTPLFRDYTDQWHTSDLASNTIVIAAQNGVYTVALNGAQLYQGDFSGASVPSEGTIALGAWIPLSLGSVSAEAAYADFTLTVP